MITVYIVAELNVGVHAVSNIAPYVIKKQCTTKFLWEKSRLARAQLLRPVQSEKEPTNGDAMNATAFIRSEPEDDFLFR